jgi:hypothetical protein
MSSGPSCPRHILAAVFLLAAALPVSAQQPAAPTGRTASVSGGFDVRNHYMFRGVRQNSTEIAMSPFVDFGISPFVSEGSIKRIGINVGFWNSLHTGDTGSGGPASKLWYESDFSGTFGVTFSRGVSLGTTYTAYVSPNDMFSTVKEISFRLALDDTKRIVATNPYALVAFELGADIGEGQVDGGIHGGKYLELGIGPQFGPRIGSISFPVKLGLSLDNYYELGGEDNRFGFLSVGSRIAVPLGPAWHARGGVDYMRLGETTKAFNSGDASKIVGTIGVVFSY